MGRPGCVRGRQTGVGLALDPAAGMLPVVAAIIERSARDLAAAIRAGELSAREVVEAHAWRLHRRQPRTNALACDRFADALDGRRGRRRADRAAGPTSAAAVPGRAVHDQGVDRAARDAQLRRHGGAARPPRRDHRAGGPAADRRRLHPARRHEHVGADDVDRVRQPRLRPHPQRLRPAAHGRRLLGRRGRGGRLAAARRSGSARTSPARSGCPRSSTASSATSRSPGLVPNTRPVPEHRWRGGVHAHARAARAPRRGPDAGDADRLRAGRGGPALRRARARRPRGGRPAELRVLLADRRRSCPPARAARRARPRRAGARGRRRAGASTSIAQAAAARARAVHGRARRRRGRDAERAARAAGRPPHGARPWADALRGRGDHTTRDPDHARGRAPPRPRAGRRAPGRALAAVHALRAEVAASSATTRAAAPPAPARGAEARRHGRPRLGDHARRRSSTCSACP